MPNEISNIKPHLVHTHDVQLDSDYTQWLVELKARYRSAQLKAAVRVNAEKLRQFVAEISLAPKLTRARNRLIKES